MRWSIILTLGVFVGGAGAVRADEVMPPQNVKAEPSSPQSAALASRSATAEMVGNPQSALKLADKAIHANPKDPWPYYDKAMALSRIGEVDGALAAFVASEQHFAPNDRWGRSVAVFGRAHALSEVGRCGEAKLAFDDYAKILEDDAQAVALAKRYETACSR